MQLRSLQADVLGVSQMIRMSQFLRMHRMGSAYDDEAEWLSGETVATPTVWEGQPYLAGQVMIPLYPSGKPSPDAVT